MTIAEIDAALDNLKPTTPLSITGFLRDRRPDGFYYPVTGPSATDGTRLPKLPAVSSWPNFSGEFTKGKVQLEGEGEGANEEAPANTQRSSSNEEGIQASGPQKAATPPSSNPAPSSNKRPRSSTPHNDNDDDIPSVKRTKISPSRGTDETVELFTQPTPPRVEVEENDILYSAYGVDMAMSYMERKCPGSEFLACGKVEGRRWVVGVDDKGIFLLSILLEGLIDVLGQLKLFLLLRVREDRDRQSGARYTKSQQLISWRLRPRVPSINARWLNCPSNSSNATNRSVGSAMKQSPNSSQGRLFPLMFLLEKQRRRGKECWRRKAN
jgi:hypothetical protein